MITSLMILANKASCCSLLIISRATLLRSSCHLTMVDKDSTYCALKAISSHSVSRFAFVLTWNVTTFIHFLRGWRFYDCSIAHKCRCPCSCCYCQSTLLRLSLISYHHYGCFHLRSFCCCRKRINSKIILSLWYWFSETQAMRLEVSTCLVTT